jgi:hypothetical protein
MKDKINTSKQEAVSGLKGAVMLFRSVALFILVGAAVYLISEVPMRNEYYIVISVALATVGIEAGVLFWQNLKKLGK